MSKRVTLTKKQADALNDVMLNFHFKTEVVESHVAGDGCGWKGKYHPLNDLDLDTLIRALYIGYEIDKTPEEKVREYYERLERNYKDPRFSSNSAYDQMTAVQKTLDFLGIKIEGVNDND